LLNDFFFLIEIADVITDDKEDDMHDNKAAPDEGCRNQYRGCMIEHSLIVHKNSFKVGVCALELDYLFDPETIRCAIDNRVDNARKTAREDYKL
jgi:hypothetical protein